MKVSCVIPAYNEEKTIEKVISEVKPFVDEIIVINDGSKDQTLKIAKQKNIVVLSHIINRGQGAALETGNQYALLSGADVIVHFDADGQFSAQEIPRVIKPIIENKVEAVFGSRFLGIRSKIPWSKNYMILPIARFINKIFLNINLTDPQSGFRALSRKAAKNISIENDGMAHASEILYKIFNKKIKAQEVAITVSYHEFGQKITGGIKIIEDLLLSKLLKE